MRRILSLLFGGIGALTLLTLLARVVGFLRVWVQNGALGDTLTGVAFSTSNTVPNILFEVVAGGALAGTVIPLVAGFLAQHLRDAMERTIGALVTWVSVIGCVLAAIVVVCAEPITSFLLGADTSAGTHAVAVALLRMFAIQIPLYGISVICSGVLQAHKRFVLPALTPLLSSLVVIGTFAGFAHMAGGLQNSPELLSAQSIALLGWGTTCGVVALSLPQLWACSRLVPLRPHLHFPQGVAKKVAGLMSAGLGGLLAQQLQILAIMLVANTSSGASGAYPIYQFANSVYMLPYAVFAVPIATVTFPRLSAAASVGKRDEFNVIASHSTRLISEVALVAAALLVALASPATVVFAVLRPVDGFEIALLSLAPGIFGYCLVYHCSRVFFAMQASKRAAFASSLAWLCGVASLLIWALVGIDGRREALVAIGISHSVGMCVAALVLIALLYRELGSQFLMLLLTRAVPVGVVCMVAAWGGRYLSSILLGFFGTSMLGGLIVAALVGLLILGIGAGSIVLLDRRALSATRA